MVFSDPIFIVGFLPASLIIFHLARLYAPGTAAVGVIVVLSMLFYAYWSTLFLLLLLGQIALNYLFGTRLEKSRDRQTLVVAIVFNLCLLGYFKYRNFFVENFASAFGWHLRLATLIIPLGISFHTFQQIAFLIDLKKGTIKLPPILNYIMFVLFFPQLIAGPIVLHREMAKQVEELRAGHGRGLEYFGAGLLIFVFGLFKKVGLADNIAPFSDVAFWPGRSLMMPEALAGAIAFTLQLFFDFSGYSDMAVGLGLMFGFKLPNNFLMPYTATSILEFWRRWHITLMRFFTDYLYNPLWLKLRRLLRQVRPRPGLARDFLVAMAPATLVTFFLSGLWHGAGWTFICFGLAHGAAVTVNQAWRLAGLPFSRRLGWVLTMLVVIVGAVYFRANDLKQAHYILHQMFLPSEPLSVPSWLYSHLPVELPIGTFTLFSELRGTVLCLAWIALLGSLSLLLPVPAAAPDDLVPTRAKAVAMACMTWLVLNFIGAPHTFIYFAF